MTRLGDGGLLEFIELAAELALHFGRTGPELVEKAGNLSFLAEQGDTRLLDFLGRAALEVVHARQQLFYLFFHIGLR